MSTVVAEVKSPSSAQAPALLASEKPAVEKVVVHPLVLLSVVDHFNRMAKIGNQKRVVGLLLGSWSSKGVLDISNSFAVPFDEDERDKKVWYLDHEYLEQMYHMFKKVRRQSPNFPMSLCCAYKSTFTSLDNFPREMSQYYLNTSR
jgi:hypothetical protein